MKAVPEVCSFAFLALAVLAAASLLWSTFRLGIGPLPTSRAVRAALLRLVPPGQGGLVYELGSGFGGLARALARACPGATVVGVEASLVPWAISRLWQAVAPLPNLRLVRGDLFAQPLERGDLLVCYLFTGGMRALAERASFKPGAVLLSSTFALPGRAAEAAARAADLFGSKVYRYRL